MWFGKNELSLYLNGAKISSIGGGRGPRGPPSKYAHGTTHVAVHPSVRITVYFDSFVVSYKIKMHVSKAF